MTHSSFNIACISYFRWHYDCVNIYDMILKKHPNDITNTDSIYVYSITMQNDYTNQYIDAISIRKESVLKEADVNFPALTGI